MKRLLILGIDPGTTLGYALIDLNGNLIKMGSSKQLDASSLVIETIKEGRVVVVGTDKGKIPGFIERLAAKIGARVIKPKEDLLVEEKRELTKEHGFANEHEKDALASAIYAFKRIRKLLRKADLQLMKTGKQGISDEVKEIMLKEDASIARAVAMVETPEKTEVRKRKRKKTGKTKHEDYLEEDYEEDSSQFERKNRTLKRKIRKIVRAKVKDVVRIKNQRIDFLAKKVIEKDSEIRKLNEKLERIKEVALRKEKYIAVKSIKNLSWDEVNRGVIGKVVYVEDPNVFSERSMDSVMEKVDIVISKKEMSGKVREKFKVVYINAEKVGMEEVEGIILINKEKLEKERNKVDLIKKVVDEYRETRK